MTVSKKRIAEIAAIADEDIDTSDIPEVTEGAFQCATLKLDTDLLITLDAALKLLPGIMPRKARSLLSESFQEIAANVSGGKEPSRALLGECVVSIDDLGELFVPDRTWGTAKVTPRGADLLIRLYRSGAFQMRKKNDSPSDTPELANYAACTPELERRQKDRNESKAARKELIDNPNLIAEDKFEFGLLDAVFWHHRGKGEHTMEIGGIQVSKSLTAYRDNSGKSQDFTVTISWTGSDGERRSLTKESRYAGNRRNDPGRNWGLGRE